MHIIITGATGLIGQRLTNHWLNQGHRITVVSRTEQHAQQCFADRVAIVTWANLTPEVLQSAQLVVNLAGASVGERRWTTARKAEILSSRVKGTMQLAKLLNELGDRAPRLFNASAIGIYGLQSQRMDSLPPAFTEETAIDSQSAPDFLSQVGREWEQAVNQQHVKAVFLRFAVVLAKEGGALPLIVRPFRFYAGGPVGTGFQPFSWVAIDDVVRAIDFLANQPEAMGPYNIVAPNAIMQAKLAQEIATVLHRPHALKMPAFALKLLLGAQMAQELLLEGQHVYPKRLLDAGFVFKYPDIASALTHLLRQS